MSRPARFKHKAPANVANEYIPAKRLKLTPISPKMGVTNMAIKKVWPGAEKKICKIPKLKTYLFFFKNVTFGSLLRALMAFVLI